MSPAELLEEAALRRREAAGYREEIAELDVLVEEADGLVIAAERAFERLSGVERSGARRLFRGAAS